MAIPGGGVRLRGPRAGERVQQSARSAGRVPLSSLLAESDADRRRREAQEEERRLEQEGNAQQHWGTSWDGAHSAADAAADVRQGRTSPAEDAANALYERGGGVRGGGGSSSGGKWDDYLDPQSAAWLRSLFTPTDVAAQEAQARANSEAALGRAQADLEARGGMAGMGLVGGQIAMGSDLQRQAAQQLTDQILGIQDAAAQRDLQRGTIAAEFLDRGVQRGQEDEWTLALLEALGLGEEDAPPTTGGGQGAVSPNIVTGEDSWVGDMLDKDPGQMTALPGHPNNPIPASRPGDIPQPATQTADGLWIGADGQYYRTRGDRR